MEIPTAGSGSVIGDIFLSTVASGDLETLKKMVAKMDDYVEKRDEYVGLSFDKIRGFDGKTGLHLAAGFGNTSMCEYLIKALKIDVNVEDDSGATPLMWAVSHPNLQTALYLLDNGASIAEDKIMKGTPLHVAVYHDSQSLPKCKTLFQAIVSRGADIEANSYRGTPLTVAASYGNKEAVEFLLQNKANLNPVNSLSNPLIEATSVSLVCTDLLVKAGADPNINFYCTTPLHSAVEGDKVEIVVYLLKAGANPNVVNYAGLTPLEIATMGGNMKEMMVLFPVTTKIPSVQNWSIRGVMKYVKSAEARKKMDLKTKQSFLMAKSKGEEAFKRKDYWVAINWYCMANEAVPHDASILSNLSLCYARMDRGTRAVCYAEECISVRPDWPKAHYREGVAWMILKKYNKAAESFSNALNLEPDDLEIQKALREAVEAEVAEMGI